MEYSGPVAALKYFGNRWLLQTTCADYAGSSGGLPPPSPPAEKATGPFTGRARLIQHRFHRMDIHAPRCLNMGGDIIVKERS